MRDILGIQEPALVGAGANGSSANGNGHAFWLSGVVWEEVHSLESVQHRNLTKLAALLQREGVVLFIDQLEERPILIESGNVPLRRMNCVI